MSLQLFCIPPSLIIIEMKKQGIYSLLDYVITFDVLFTLSPTLLFSICSFAYSHRNLFGRNQKLNISLERGQIDSIFRINYTDPWIEGDDKRTSRTIIVQVGFAFTFWMIGRLIII